MGASCKTCDSPPVIRDLIERMRTAGISYRDAAICVKAAREYEISHAAIQRHEVEGHFSVDAVLASAMPAFGLEDLSIKTMVTRKAQLYWAQNKDVVPSTKEMVEWFKLVAQFAEADKAVAEAETIRRAFSRQEKPKELGAISG